MANIRDIIARVDDIKPNAFTDKTKLAWIGELDGRIAADVMLMGIEDIRQMEYTYPDGLDAEPLVGFPHDGLYEQYLCAKVDYANGEYSKYQNSMEMFNAHYEDFVNWFIRTYAPGQGYPCSVTGKGPYYISAYGLAVTQGYTGTLQEWLESLHGAEVELRCVDDMIQWRLKVEPEEEWQDLVSVAEFQKEAATAAKRAEEAAAKLEGGLVLRKDKGDDSIVRVLSLPSGDGQNDPTPIATGEGAIALGRYSKAYAKNSFNVGYNATTGVNPEEGGDEAEGRYSFAANESTVAKGRAAAAFNGSGQAIGDYSFAANSANRANGIGATAFGYLTIADGKHAFTMGEHTKASGQRSFAGGYGSGNTYTSALSDNSFTFGHNTFAGKTDGLTDEDDGKCCTAFGKNNRAAGANSFVANFGNQALGVNSAAFGQNSAASHKNTFVQGEGLKTSRTGQAVFGRYNRGSSDAWLVVGNGTGEQDRRNTFEVKDNSIVVGGVELPAEMLKYHVDGSAYVESDEAFNNQCIAWFNALGDWHFGRYVLNKIGGVFFVEIFRTNENYGVFKSTLYNGINGASVGYGSIYGGKFTGFNYVSFENHKHDGVYSPAGHNHDGAYSATGHSHDDRYYTEEEIDEKFSNIGGGGSAGMLREFDTGAISVSEYTHTGTRSKFYTVLVAVGVTNVSCVVDYRQLRDSTNGIYYYLPSTTGSLWVRIVDGTVVFKVSSDCKISHICGYY